MSSVISVIEQCVTVKAFEKPSLVHHTLQAPFSSDQVKCSHFIET